MKKILAGLIAACSFGVQAQSAMVFVPSSISAVRFVTEWRSQDKLENTVPVIVQSSGTGDTCDQALTNAKRYALEKVNGTWVHSVERSKDGKYNEEIVQYSGGVIKSYKFLLNECTTVVIEAEVMKRSNRVQMEAANIRKDQVIHLQGIKETQDRKQQAVSKIDNRASAIYFKPKNTEMRVGDDGFALVRIKGEFGYNDKWRADYLELREQFGYFNLESFIPPARVVITALDSARLPVYKTSFENDDWELWGRRTYGASPTVDVYTNKTEDVTVKFRIPIDKLDEVKSFKVEVL
jgi:hypothetical protein